MSTRRRHPLHRRLATVAVAAVLAATAGACSSDSSDSSDAGPAGSEAAAGTSGAAASSPTSTNPGVAATIPTDFTGTVDEFYDVPDPLPAGQPGDVIRIQEVAPDAGDPGVRIMYLTEDRLGTPRVSTGLVYHPAGDAPDGGWPVIAAGHGTTGIIAKCAPSRLGYAPSGYGVKGVRVQSDYIGLGPNDELHPYLSRTAEGNAMLDGLIAARKILGDDMGADVVAVGHSQGGHAVLATSELFDERADGFNLLGTVAVAPGAQMTENYDDDLQLRIITSMVILGSGSEWPDVQPEALMTPETLKTVSDIELNNCLDVIVPAMIPLAASPDLYTEDLDNVDAVEEWKQANDVATETFDAPLLLLTGGADITVVPARVEGLYERLCKLGQETEYEVYPDADHNTEMGVANQRITDWVQARFAGEPATSTCP